MRLCVASIKLEFCHFSFQSCCLGNESFWWCGWISSKILQLPSCLQCDPLYVCLHPNGLHGRGQGVVQPGNSGREEDTSAVDDDVPEKEMALRPYFWQNTKYKMKSTHKILSI